jgi:2-polyprenyl-3-methyl-5-hydroxy-6-metoxy-1,4-benzoquinol methylase
MQKSERREMRMLAAYESLGRTGVVNDHPIWVDNQLRAIYANQPSDGVIVDVGCGDGRFCTILPELGIEAKRYLGIDACHSQVALAKKLRPGHRFEVCSVYDLGKRHPDRFHGFACTAMLMLLPRERLPEALVSLRKSLQMDAAGLVSTPEGKGDLRRSQGVVISLYKARELEKVFRSAGFEAAFSNVDGVMLAGAATAV